MKIRHKGKYPCPACTRQQMMELTLGETPIGWYCADGCGSVFEFQWAIKDMKLLILAARRNPEIQKNLTPGTSEWERYVETQELMKEGEPLFDNIYVLEEMFVETPSLT